MTNRRGIELFARDYPHDYPEVEAILMLHSHRLRIHEVPVRMNARGFGRSSIDYPRSAYYMAKVLLALFVGLFRRRPTPVEDPPAEGELVEPPAPRPRDNRRCGGSDPSSPRPTEVGTKAQIVAVLVAAIMLGVVLELVRRRRLVERYALLWMLAAVAMLGLAVWSDGLKTPGRCLSGSSSPPNALFLAALGVVFVLLLHFSIADLAALGGDEDPRPGGRAARRRGPDGSRGVERQRRRAGEAQPRAGRPRPPPSSASTTDQ